MKIVENIQRVFRPLGLRFGQWARIWRGRYSAIRLLLDPNRLTDVFEIDEAVSTEEAARRVGDQLRRHPRGAAAMVEWPRVGPINRGALRALPTGTLGRAYADFLDEHGLDPSSIPTKQATDEASYMRAHFYETHDIWHVVTGFGTDVPGELAVQAAYLAQFHGALPPLLLAGGLLNAAFFAREDYTARLEAIFDGYRIGKEAEPLFGVRWNELWGEPLADVRRELGVVARAPSA